MRVLLIVAAILYAVFLPGGAVAQPRGTGNVIFFHPDGMGVSHWGAVRLHTVGPDGRLHWDRLPAMAVYLGHMQDAVASTSEGGASTHAYGVRTNSNAYGMHEGERTRPLSGGQGSIAHQAMARGRWVGLVNSGDAVEPGTGAFIASVQRRSNRDEIVAQLVDSGVRVHLAGGEQWYLPRGTMGRFGEGRRADGRNLVEELRAKGYAVVFTADELKALPADTTRIWGIFAREHIFNARKEADLARENLPLYQPGSPTVSEMAEAALRVLARAPDGFFLVVEEEGTDNFANSNNATGQLEAGRRTDEAIGLFARHVAANPRTLMLTTSDSDAGGMQVVGPGVLDRRRIREGQPMAERDGNGAPWDGPTGTASMPFMSAPDRNGRRHRFAITWATDDDVAGGILVRGVGLNSNLISGTMENTDIYRVMYRTLFGELPR
ncbi:MAG TPA: alkaline phosphatase [Falsiroseomonas sp.]|jgi:alkaline phosphatase|nr:alkaline phosphatase [Falsiroseomonas sp.]